ncbi:hypothetical protein RHSIM_Rhsim04G0202700 [Rhododendron simsii]|uniref:Galactose oxidase/kelch repeat superfamily protein n=1 Tax=Rhododendron simsii TaxID=118357 RepID=A0A834H4S2_RHOSS|nr:hypothetical protein RHSIM_Rhsim04G0202700 [Rhododendron simsii]
MGKGRETSAAAMGKGVGRETSVCLRVVMDGVQRPAPLLWYVVNLSDSFLQPCSKGNVKRMEIEAKRRDIEFMQKCTEDMERKFEEEEEEEEEEKKKDESDPMLNPVWQTEGIPEFCFWTARDSTIYCLGAKRSGEPSYGRNFRDFDLLDLSEVVNTGPPMIRKRCNGKAVIARNNIYVFGGAKKAPWGEVLEIKGGEEGAEWKALNEPPMRIPPSDVFAFPLDDAANGIIVTSDGMDGLFLYNVFEDSWNVLDEKFSFDGPSFTEPVIVGRSIYWVGSDESMCSYDLDTKELYRGDIDFLPLKDALDTVRFCRMSYRLPLLHLHGDIFCLIWLDVNLDRSQPRSVFVFHKMHVSRRFGKKEGEHSLRVKPVSTDYFLTDHGLIFYFDGLVL